MFNTITTEDAYNTLTGFAQRHFIIFHLTFKYKLLGILHFKISCELEENRVKAHSCTKM